VQQLALGEEMDVNREYAIENLQNISNKQGYITFDDIINTSEKYMLSLQDVDLLSSTLTEKGILIKEDFIDNADVNDGEIDEFADFAHEDYENIYSNILAVAPTAESLINEVRKIVPPQWKEFEQLKYQIREGNQYAKNRVIEMYLRLAIKMAFQRSETYDVEFSDLLSDAFIGLINAVNRYDPDTNGAFQSYASMWILQSMSRGQGTQRATIYYPFHRKEGYFGMYPFFKKYGCLECDEFGKCNKAVDLVKDMAGLEGNDARYAIEACIPLDSYDVILEKYELCDMKAMPRELISDFDVDDSLFGDELKQVVDDSLNKLSDREKEVIVLRYGIIDGKERTLEEVGESFGVTRERIRQIESKAFKRLRHPSKSKILKEYY